ncbi:MFS transporter [Nocardiopsis ganjiahuensis]|uniref:MFS transporter n=1 Tax=Nocardiopsis ganjiahuensis TaxID=239984 RepID=UPI0003814D91|nr:MFS transporter [Nocardiopsis ganjiahuensis]
MGTFLMLTTEFVVAGILPDIAEGLGVSLARVGSLITVFAAGMIVGAPLMTMLTVRLSPRLTLILALGIFVAGHVWVALASDVDQIVIARFLTGLATGAFWAVSAVVASRAAGSAMGSRAVGIVAAGGSLATVLGVPIGAYVAQLTGWRGTFWALAIAAALVTVLVSRSVPRDEPANGERPSLVADLAGLLSVRLWLVLLACATTSGGVLAAYSFIAPVLIGRSGVPASAVPLVLTVFGIGSFVGTLVAGRLGDRHPHAVTIVTPAVSTVLMAAIFLFSCWSWAMVTLIALLGLFGLSANGVLIHLAVRFSGRAASLGSALSVAAFNLGTAVVTPVAGAALASPLGLDGPAAVGTAVIALTLIPTTVLGIITLRRGRTRSGRDSADGSSRRGLSEAPHNAFPGTLR